MQNTFRSGLLLLVLGAFGSFSADAFSLNGPGVTMNAALAADVPCLNRNSYGGIVNNCATPREVVGTLDVDGNLWHLTSVFIFGNNSWCQTVSTNTVGNGAQVGPLTWTLAGPPAWQNLATGNRFVWANTALLFRCYLEPGGIIGKIEAD